MKKKKFRLKITSFFIAGVMAIALLAAGCGSGRDVSAEKDYRTKGIAQMEAGNYDKALQYFDQALDSAGKKYADLELDISFYKALAEYRTGDNSAALKTCRTMMNYNDENFRPYYLRGCIYAADQNLKRAKSDFDQAVSRNEEDYELYRNIYQALENADDEKDARSYLRQALKISGSDADDQAEKGYITYLLGKTKQASSQLKSAAKDGSSKASFYQGIIAAEAGNEDTAKTYFDQFYEANKNDADALLQLAAAAMNAGAPEAAETYYQAAGEQAGTDSDRQKAAKGRISACEHSGDYEKADSLLKSYRKTYPDDASAKKEQQFIDTRLDESSSQTYASDNQSDSSTTENPSDTQSASAETN